MRNGTADISKNAGQLKDSIVAGMGHMVDVGRKAVAEKAVDAKDAVVGGGRRAIEATAKAIRKRPFLAVSIAFGLGYIGMRFVRR